MWARLVVVVASSVLRTTARLHRGLGGWWQMPGSTPGTGPGSGVFSGNGFSEVSGRLASPAFSYSGSLWWASELIPMKALCWHKWRGSAVGGGKNTNQFESRSSHTRSPLFCIPLFKCLPVFFSPPLNQMFFVFLCVCMDPRFGILVTLMNPFSE